MNRNEIREMGTKILASAYVHPPPLCAPASPLLQGGSQKRGTAVTSVTPALSLPPYRLRLPRRVGSRLTILLSQRSRTHKLCPCATVLEKFIASPQPPCSRPLCCISTEKGSTLVGFEHILVHINTPPGLLLQQASALVK